VSAPAKISPISPAMLRLIEDLARIDVQDYLREEAAARQSEAARSDHVALPGYDKAA